LERLKIMDGDEALERITALARVDVRKMFPPDSPIAQLPDDVAIAVKSVTPTRYGLRIEVYDALRANELMAKSAGRLKDQVKVDAPTLAELMAAANETRAVGAPPAAEKER
jgi:hypothetical protein